MKDDNKYVFLCGDKFSAIDVGYCQGVKVATIAMGTMSEAFDVVTDEMCNCWRDEEAKAIGLDMWKEWLDK